MRVVFDTNLVVSGLLWSGTPRHVLNTASERRVDAITSEALVDELRDVLKRDKFRRFLERLKKTPEELVSDYLRYANVIEPALVPQAAIRDLNDVKVLEAALGGKAVCIVSGDDDLLSMQTYQTIRIMNARAFLVWIESGDAT